MSPTRAAASGLSGAAPTVASIAAVAAGCAAALLGAGAGELAAALFAPVSSPFAVVGGALIDAAPGWAKDLAIAWFGTADKAALLIGIGVVLLVLAAAAGLCEARLRWSGAIVLAATGVVVAAIAPTRSGAEALAWLPSLLAGAAAAGALRLLIRKAPEPAPAPVRTTAPATAPAATRATVPAEGSSPSRRGFLAWSGGAAALGVVAVIAGSAARAGSAIATAARAAIRLPRAATPAPPLPAGAALDVHGITPLITPNKDFYRIDTALLPPAVDPSEWKLRIHGMVAREVELSWEELLALPLVETTLTLSCVSNEVGGRLVGNATWLGYPIRDLLAEARPDPAADMVLSTSADGFTAGTPLEALTDGRDALLAVGMNGRPLPLEHGFPARMVVPGLYGYVSATKWVTDLEVTRFDRASAYWTVRGWSERGPIKLESRIDVPQPGPGLDAGDTVIAGVAWQPGTGVSGVEVQVDDGPWQRAELATAISDDTWVQWRLPWRAAAGEHRIRCRAIDADGAVQTGAVAPPVPDGATGWHTIDVTVGS